MNLRLSETTMLQITFVTTTSTRHPLFRLRWILIISGTFSLVSDIIVAALFSQRQAIPVWSLLAFFALLSILLSVYDLSLRDRSPTSPHSQALPAARRPHGRTPQSSAQASQSKTSSSTQKQQQQTPILAEVDNDANIIGTSVDEERLPFLPPRAESGSEKSEDEEEEHDNKSNKPTLHPSKVMTAFDLIIAAALILLHIANMIVGSLVTKYDMYWHVNDEAYALRAHAIVATFIMIVVHVHCFAKQVKALRRDRRNKGYQRVGGAVRI